MTAIEKAIDSIRALPEELAEKTVSFIEELKRQQHEERNQILDQLAGSMTTEEADMMWETIKRDCRCLERSLPLKINDFVFLSIVGQRDA